MSEARKMDRPITRADDLMKAYRRAEHRLAEVLFGDGEYTMGAVRGEERRLEVSRALRAMRSAFEAAVDKSQPGRAEEAEARIADLEEELRRLASSKARTARRPTSG